jgi:FG-GAP-like repeat
MKKVPVIVIAVFMLICSLAFADKPLGPVEMTSVDELAYAIAAYFPKVQGEVTSVQGDQITISLGEKNGLLPGMVLTVWRDGKEIIHPVTKAVIGRAEDEVGTIEVVAVQEKTSLAVLKKQMLQPKAGDRARITPKGISLAILPLRVDKPEIIKDLATRLGELGRFTITPNDKVAAFLRDRKQRDTSLVREMGTTFSLDAVVAVSIYPTEGKYLVQSSLFTADDGKTIDTITTMLNLTSKREALGDVRPFFAPVKDLSGKMPDVPVAARYFAIADLDGDGAAEYVFSDEKKLSIYRTDKSGWKELWTEPVDRKEQEMQQFHIDVADINGNGRPEIFVTRMLDGKVSSYVVEFENGSFRRIANMPVFLRVVRYPGKKGLVLIGQEYAPESFFAGQPHEYAWSGSAYTPGAPVVLPKGTDLYSFIYADFGEPRLLLVSFDDDHRLVVYSGDTPLWRSEERYLTVETVLTKPLTGMDAVMGREPTEMDKTNVSVASRVDKSRLVRISGRIAAVDLYGSGKDDIVVVKNTPATFLGGYKGGELEVLTWTGARLEPRWNIKDLAGPILDIQVTRQDKAGVQINGLVKVSGGIFGKDALRVEKYEGK